MFQDAATYNATLTIYAQGFMAQREQSLIDWMAPFVPTGIASGDYKLFDKDDPFQIYDNTVIPEDGESRTVHFNATTEKFNCEPHGLKIPIRDWERNQAGKEGYEVLRMGKMSTLLSTQLVNREFAGFKKIFAGVTAETGKGVWKGSPGSAKDPIDEIDDLIDSISIATGQMPNALAMSQSVYRILKNHPVVRSRVSGISKSVTIEDIRGMLINPNIEIRVGSMPCKRSPLGKKADKTSIIGNELLVFHRSQAPTTEDLSAFKTFTIDSGGLAEVHTHQESLTHKSYEEVMWSEDLRVTAPIAVKRLSIT